MRRSALLSTAFHEAGHVVVCWRQRVRVRNATIIPAKDYLGQVTHANFLRGINLDCDNSARGERRAKELAIVCLVGPAAQRRHNPRSIRRHHCSGDYDLATRLALTMNGSSEATNAYLKWLEAVTHDMVAASWPQIEKVARALFERRTLTAQEVQVALNPVGNVDFSELAKGLHVRDEDQPLPQGQVHV